jgi:hypothetical protein
MLHLMTLILAFSLREKELPLPLGEGWGEGGIASNYYHHP